MHLLEQNKDTTSLKATTKRIDCKINWFNLSYNPSAMVLLEQNIDKINWEGFSQNPSIFELDYDFLFQRMNIIRQELMVKTWHPDRFQDWCLSIQDKM